MLLNLFLCALAVFWAVQFVKLFPYYQLTSAGALIAVLLLSAGFSLWLYGPTEQGLQLALGTAGLSGLIHQIHRVLWALGDEKRMTVISRGRRRSPTLF